MTRTIPQTDPGANYRARRDAIDASIARVAAGGRYILGEESRAFEQEFATHVGCSTTIGVASGTDALELALRACGIGPGDAVVTVSHTAVATVAAIERAGALPLMCDIDADRYTIDPERAESVITAATRDGHRVRAIVPVHLYGAMADMHAIAGIARRFDLRVVEDCAQAHGARLDGRRAGTWGDAASFSFYPTKNLGALGDGGAVATSDADIAARVRLLREYGWRERYVSSVPGMNSRLDELQAAVLRVKLAGLDADNTRRRAIADAYNAGLRVDRTPYVAPGVEHVYHQYVVTVEQRERFRDRLRAAGVGTLVHYPVPVHLQPAYAGRLPLYAPMERTELLAAQVTSLPMFPELTDDDVAYVIECVNAVAVPAH